MLKVPVSGFPHAHILSLMNQLPVRKGMRIAFEKWKAERGSVRERQTPKVSGESAKRALDLALEITRLAQASAPRREL